MIEVAANDGYLLRNFVDAGIPCLGIEPTAATADATEAVGVPVLREFFGSALGHSLAAEGRQADLLIGNNVYAYVPDINDYTAGLQAALKPGGTLTLEFPHLLQLLRHTQFDTVYHEHFSYLSLHAVQRIFVAHGLRVWEVEELSTHGGSLRVYGVHSADERTSTPTVEAVLAAQQQAGLLDLAAYHEFQARAETVKNDLLAHLLEARRAGRRIVGYGAAAKGNTLLNFAGVCPDLLPAVYDAAPAKQGKYLPGSNIPIRSSHEMEADPVEEILILPWNIAGEIKKQITASMKTTLSFIKAVPVIEVM